MCQSQKSQNQFQFTFKIIVFGSLTFVFCIDKFRQVTVTVTQSQTINRLLQALINMNSCEKCNQTKFIDQFSNLNLCQECASSLNQQSSNFEPDTDIEIPFSSTGSKNASLTKYSVKLDPKTMINYISILRKYSPYHPLPNELTDIVATYLIPIDGIFRVGHKNDKDWAKKEHDRYHNNHPGSDFEMQRLTLNSKHFSWKWEYSMHEYGFGGMFGGSENDVASFSGLYLIRNLNDITGNNNNNNNNNNHIDIKDIKSKNERNPDELILELVVDLEKKQNCRKEFLPKRCKNAKCSLYLRLKETAAIEWKYDTIARKYKTVKKFAWMAKCLNGLMNHELIFDTENLGVSNS